MPATVRTPSSGEPSAATRARPAEREPVVAQTDFRAYKRAACQGFTMSF